MQQVKLSNLNRTQKIQSWKQGKKYVKSSDYHQFVQSKLYRMKERFGYENNKKDIQSIKYLKEQFDHKFQVKFGNRTKLRCKRLGNKDKYERNLLTGKFLKNNPFQFILQKLGKKVELKEKKFAFSILQFHFGQ